MIPEEEYVWSFAGVDFAREVGDTYARRPRKMSPFSVDHVLDSDDAYRDSAGSLYEPFQILAAVNDEGEVDALLSKVGVTGILSGPRWTGVRILTSAEASYRPTYIAIDCTFA
jgi:hypothetical protein